MSERTDLHIVRVASTVCTRCTAIGAPFDAEGLCERCRSYAEIARLTTRWSPAQRTALADVIFAALRFMPPEDATELFDLVSDLVVAEH